MPTDAVDPRERKLIGSYRPYSAGGPPMLFLPGGVALAYRLSEPLTWQFYEPASAMNVITTAPGEPPVHWLMTTDPVSGLVRRLQRSDPSGTQFYVHRVQADWAPIQWATAGYGPAFIADDGDAE